MKASRRGRAFAVLFVLNYALTGAGYFWLSHQADNADAAQQLAAAAQRRGGQLVEQKLCTSFGKLAALQPPAGDPDSNPSRAYLQGQHAVLVELGTDIGCKG